MEESNDGTRAGFRVSWDAECPGAALGTVTSGLDGTPMVILGDDTFETDVGYRYDTSGGDVANVSGQFAGRMTDGTVTGTWSARLVIKGAGGEVVDVCEPSLVTWEAYRE